MMELEHKELTEQIIGAAFEVYRVLGYGFLERENGVLVVLVRVHSVFHPWLNRNGS
jgi:hypothetical protein